MTDEAERDATVVQDERMTALESLAQANMAAMTQVRGLRDDIARVDASRGRDLNLFKWAMALVLILVFGVVLIVLTNRPILDLIKSTVTPGGAIYKANAERTAILLNNLAAENDCRHRRALADLPPPPTTVVIKNGNAVALTRTPCGDLPDSPTGFVSPPPVHTQPEPPSGDGPNPVPYVVLVTAAAVAVVAVYRNRTKEENAT